MNLGQIAKMMTTSLAVTPNMRSEFGLLFLLHSILLQWRNSQGGRGQNPQPRHRPTSHREISADLPGKERQKKKKKKKKKRKLRIKEGKSKREGAIENGRGRKVAK